jgi:subtilisin-like proprotein convertase family protein/subtilisin family serine protease
VTARIQTTILLLFVAGVIPGNAADRILAFTFKEPAVRTYNLLVPHDLGGHPVRTTGRLRVAPGTKAGLAREFSATVVMGLHHGIDLEPIMAGSQLKLARRFAQQVFILKAPDALTAAEEAQRLSRSVGVRFCHPDIHAPRKAAGPYARKPSDERFDDQFYLEAHSAAGLENAISVNAREAWAFTKGAGVVIAIGDTGADLAHPDLLPATLGQPHYNFETLTTNSNHAPSDQGHGTAVAGLAAARGYNGIGMAGTAPMASLAIWKLLNQSSSVIIADMFRYASNIVSVQNHSWSWGSSSQVDISEVEKIAITNVFRHGRNGRGTILVRASGNNRSINANDSSLLNPTQIVGDANDDGYTQDPYSIVVAAIRSTGKVASYSSPGACVLVAAPSGDVGFPRLFTTDRVGADGFNNGSCLDFPDCGNYAFGSHGFNGTSAASPIIAGVAALIVGANTNLNARDVHLIMALSARHTDAEDLDLQTNGAGLVISHNVGYGVPNAGEAVRLARLWSNRPPRTEITSRQTPTNAISIPDLGHLVRSTGTGVPGNLLSIPGHFPSETRHPEFAPGEWRAPDLETTTIPVTFVGKATNTLTTDLTGRAALIERGDALFIDKLERAEAAGAEFAIVYNNDTNAPDTLVNMGLSRPNTYPAIFVGKTLGEQLRDHSGTNSQLRVQLVRDGPRFSFAITNQLLCEHVSVRIRASHPLRRNLRFTLYSPAGTRSRLQRSLVSIGPLAYQNEDASNLDWTYHSVLHLGESSVGDWLVQVVDEETGNTGTVQEVKLFIKGVPISDTDADGLDDSWETAHFGSLSANPREDPDKDGYVNSREQLMGTLPNSMDPQFALTLDASAFTADRTRVSWPSSTNFNYTIETSTTATGPYSPSTTPPSRFPVTEAFLGTTNGSRGYFRVTASPAQ